MIETKPGVGHNAHDDQMQKYVIDEYAGTSKPFYYYRGSTRDIDWQTGEFEAEKILAHKRGRDGKWLFKVKWKDCDATDNSWEPVNHFFHRYSSALVKYGRKKSLKRVRRDAKLVERVDGLGGGEGFCCFLIPTKPRLSDQQAWFWFILFVR